MAMSFVSLACLPVANAQTLAFPPPVLILPLSAFMLGEGAGLCGRDGVPAGAYQVDGPNRKASTIAFWFVRTARLAGQRGRGGHIAANEAIACAPVSLLAPIGLPALIRALGFDLLIFSQPLAWWG